MNGLKTIFLSLLMGTSALLLASCGHEAKVPAQFTELKDTVQLYPDYQNDIVIPPNIAPLNFRLKNTADAGDEFVVTVEGAGQRVEASAKGDEALQFDTLQWRKLLTDNKGKSLKISVYAHREQGWVRYRPLTWTVAEEPIDDYLSYRLIEPGYEIYRQLGLYQRNLTNFDERVIYENNRSYDSENNHCVNCHNYQNYSTETMLFHIRAAHGGTLIARGGKLQKINLKNDSILGAGVYPTWHPSKPWVVFSSNQTGQAFHILHPQKVEVVDEASDLIFYDADRNVVKNILKTADAFETFPCWNPSGDRIYYCEARNTAISDAPDSLRQRRLLQQYDSLHYNLMSLPFDAATQRFGTPQMEVDCAAMGKSAAIPRISPDGRYVLFTLADYGQFHIWHKSADLWVKDLQTQEVRPLAAANSADVDSYHGWSSNGRWIVFSSRRDDGSYTRLYLAYFDRNGHAHKAFLLPQEDPEQNILLLKSYNVPELTRDAVRFSPADFRQCIYGSDGTSAKYESK